MSIKNPGKEQSMNLNLKKSMLLVGALASLGLSYTNLVYFSWLGWEVVNETNVGLDFRTLNSRLTIEADWYYRRFFCGYRR